MSLESRDQVVNTLITGAARAGAGRSRGLSDLETLEALRQAQRQQYLERNARNANEEATLAALSEVDKGYRDTTTYRDDESANLVQENLAEIDKDSTPIKHEKLRRNAAGKRSAARKVDGKEQQKLRGQAQFVDNLADEAAEAQKFFDFGLSPFGDNAIYAAPRVEPELVGTRDGKQVFRYPSSDDFDNEKVALIPGGFVADDARRRAKQQDRETGRAAVRADQQGPVDLVGVLRNEVEAEKEARKIDRGTLGVRKEQGDRNFSQIQQIKKLGGVGAAAPYEEASVGFPDNSIQRETALRMYNPDGETVGYADSTGERFLGDIDLSDTLTRGELTPAQTWMAQNQPTYTPYGDHQPKVKVMDQLRLFTDRLNGLGYGTAVNTEMRSVDEFEKAINFVKAKAAEKGDKIFRPGEDGINRPIEIPQVEDVLRGKMRYTPMEAEQLAYALFQLETAKNSGVNERFKHNFEARLGNAIDDQIRFNSEGDIQLARIKNEKVGRGKGKGDRIEVRGALAKLSNEDAQKPYYAAIAGEPAPRARFLRPEAYGLANDEIMERYPKYGEDMIGVRDRFQRDVLLGARGPGNDNFAQAQHALDREFEARGPQIQGQKELAEKFELARLLSEGPTVNYRTGTAPARPAQAYAFDDSTGPIDYDKPVGAKTVDIGQGGESWETKRFAVPSDSEFNQNSKFKATAAKQPIQQAPTPSIAPTPGDITGNQPTPAVDAGRGGWMGGDNKGRVETPFSQERAARSSEGKSLTPELRAELFALPNRSGDVGRSRSNETSSDYFVEPDFSVEAEPSFRRKRSAVGGDPVGAFMTSPRHKRGRRIGYGAAGAAGVAGLASLISGERDQRDEEQYQ